jgi:hypothetical protein
VKRVVIIVTALVVAGFAVAAWALPPRELGLEPQNRPRADCPGTPCRATGKMTGFQVQQLKQRDGDRVTEFPTRVRGRNSWLVAFSLKLGNPTDEQKQFFNRLWGKPAQARISILDPEPKQGDRRNRRQRYRLHNQSQPFDLTPFFGRKAWFVLRQRIHVSRGQIVALTLPTWAPVLATDLRPRERWRSSRDPDHCDDVERQVARQKVGRLRDYRCVHTTARLLFTALIVPKTNENKR